MKKLREELKRSSAEQNMISKTLREKSKVQPGRCWPSDPGGPGAPHASSL